MPKLVELVAGATFGRWTVIERAGTNCGAAAWLCVCACGTRRPVNGKNLRNGVSVSCGCYKVEVTVRRSTTHGQAPRGRQSPEHIAWAGMLRRCTNPNDKEYARYAGQGVVVAERWKIFENFLADMGSKPSPRHSLDRHPNAFGNYEPGNARWATPQEQMQNTRRTRFVVLDGQQMPVVEASRRLGLNPSTVRLRIARGQSVRRALGLE